MSKLDTRRLQIFLGLTFGISWATALFIYLNGGLAGSRELLSGTGITLSVALIATFYMWSPALGHILTRIITKEGWKDTWLDLNFEAGARYWLFAWLLPLILTIFGAVVYYFVFPGQFDPSLGFVRELLDSRANSLPIDTETFLLIQIGQGLLLGPVINSLFTFGEEFGWRAYLQPKLMPLGYRRGLLATGAIWGMWHAPLIAMGHNYDLGYPGHPWLGILGMVWFSMAAGVIFGWLTLQGKSVWPAVIAHASINAVSGAAILFQQPAVDPNLLIGPLPPGILGGLPWTLLAAYLLWRGEPKENVSRETTRPGPRRAPKGSMIFARGLGKSFGDNVAVEELDLEIAAGEVFGLLGPNGAGKTTTIRMLSALIAPTFGGAIVAGHPIGEDDNVLRKELGILTEAPGLYLQLSAERNLTFYAQMYEVEDIPGQVERYLRMLGLWGRRSESVGTFSKGMRQKLAIARALLHEPQVLFLDEPTSGLDPEAAKIVRDFVGELRAEGRTIILTTHNLDEADRLCDRIGVLSTRLLAVDSSANLRRELFGRSVVFHLSVNNGKFLEALRQKSYVRDVKSVDSKLVVTLDDPEAHNPELVRELVKTGADIQFVGEIRQSLEDVYLQLIGRSEENHG